MKGGDLPPVKTYALLDSGSEVTLSHEQMQQELGASGPRLNFILSGMTGNHVSGAVKCENSETNANLKYLYHQEERP